MKKDKVLRPLKRKPNLTLTYPELWTLYTAYFPRSQGLSPESIVKNPKLFEVSKKLQKFFFKYEGRVL